MKNIKPALKITAKALCSIAFFAVLLSFVKTNELIDVFSRIHWGYFVGSFCLTPVMLCVSCAKWKLLLDKGRVRVPMWQLLKMYFVGYFFSNFLPSTVGGDVVRSFYAGKRINDQAYAAVSVFLERFTGILFLCVLVIVMPLFRIDLYVNPFIYLPAVGGCCALILFAFLFYAGSRDSWLNNCIIKLPGLFVSSEKAGELKVKGKIAKCLEKVTEIIVDKAKKIRSGLEIAITAMGSDKSYLVKLVALTVAFYFLTMVNVFIAFKAFSVDISFLGVCVLVPPALLVAHVPVTLLGNLGYFESIFVGYFLLIGVPGAESLAMGLLLRLKMLSLGILGLGFYLSYKSSNGAELDELKELHNHAR
ncbi:lysylphosphatidylglycerol synthase transmembrane domain-containing protein [Desulfosediminicola flagellatus]|uniref:lysylphosphatidylglycerol synthase transmembrane domain-containing protein n=1 Tax=Desulfosediminicola flagellatus TaxID=2569541 RepID=UPI0010ACFBED|nr:lysylphosphatidylglycerol synthase transmembrane domain-containing protein [Desulfosediminicola flagellatus]